MRPSRWSPSLTMPSAPRFKSCGRVIQYSGRTRSDHSLRWTNASPLSASESPQFARRATCRQWRTCCSLARGRLASSVRAGGRALGGSCVAVGPLCSAAAGPLPPRPPPPLQRRRTRWAAPSSTSSTSEASATSGRSGCTALRASLPSSLSRPFQSTTRRSWRTARSTGRARRDDALRRLSITLLEAARAGWRDLRCAHPRSHRVCYPQVVRGARLVRRGENRSPHQSVSLPAGRRSCARGTQPPRTQPAARRRCATQSGSKTGASPLRFPAYPPPHHPSASFQSNGASFARDAAASSSSSSTSAISLNGRSRAST